MSIGTPALVVDIYLQPGEFHFGASHTRIRTLLGSCVSITFWHPQRRIGGMCHYMLPSRKRANDDQLSGKYGNEAMAMFMGEVARHKSRPQEYEIKIFGGGSMMESLGRHAMAENVAERNVQQARRLMLEYGLTIKAESLGGVGYRQLVFELWSGDVWSRNVRGVVQMGGVKVK
jgi:chemotaxis protein CheD